MKQYLLKSRVALFALVMFGLLLLNSIFGVVWPLMQVQAGPTLPPRSDPAPSDNGSGGNPLVAHIELHAPPASGTWSVVQWQDINGNWHDVEGWSGALAGSGFQRWAVLSKDFDTGPFQWVVKQGQSGTANLTSAPFNLPAGAGGVLQVTVAAK